MQMAGLIQSISAQGSSIPVMYDKVAVEWRALLGTELQRNQLHSKSTEVRTLATKQSASLYCSQEKL